MPRLINDFTRTDDVTAAINDVIVERGVEGLTMRAIADRALLSPSALYHHYGSREHMLRVAAHVTGEARIGQIQWRLAEEGAGAWLPRDDEDLLLARAWLGWGEMWRTHNWLMPTVDKIREIEMSTLAQHHGYRLARDDIDTILAMVAGLLVEVCHPRRPMSRPAARRLLLRAIGPILPSADETNAA